MEMSPVQMLRARAMMPAAAWSTGGEIMPPRYTAGWSDIDPSARVTDRGSAVPPVPLLSCHAALVLFVSVLLIIITGQAIIWSGTARSDGVTERDPGHR
jgi:hypothetical protein